MDELIRKQDAIDALMAERKRLLAKGQKGAEHILTHHGYNVIDELPPVQSDVPDIYAGELISRQAATTIPVMPKEHRHYQTQNLDDAYEQGWNDLQECIENLPPVQLKNGTLIIHLNESDFKSVKRIILDNKPWCRTFYEDVPGEAHWIKKYTPDDGEIYECDNCGVTWQFNDGGPEENEAFFCPKCGFKMERGEEE